MAGRTLAPVSAGRALCVPYSVVLPRDNAVFRLAGRRAATPRVGRAGRAWERAERAERAATPATWADTRWVGERDSPTNASRIGYLIWNPAIESLAVRCSTLEGQTWTGAAVGWAAAGQCSGVTLPASRARCRRRARAGRLPAAPPRSTSWRPRDYGACEQVVSKGVSFLRFPLRPTLRPTCPRGNPSPAVRISRASRAHLARASAMTDPISRRGRRTAPRRTARTTLTTRRKLSPLVRGQREGEARGGASRTAAGTGYNAAECVLVPTPRRATFSIRPTFQAAGPLYPPP